MAQCGSHHKELNDQGYGKCSVPMWTTGLPAGFCDRIAFGTAKKNVIILEIHVSIVESHMMMLRLGLVRLI